MVDKAQYWPDGNVAMASVKQMLTNVANVRSDDEQRRPLAATKISRCGPSWTADLKEMGNHVVGCGRCKAHDQHGPTRTQERLKLCFEKCETISTTLTQFGNFSNYTYVRFFQVCGPMVYR